MTNTPEILKMTKNIQKRISKPKYPKISKMSQNSNRK